jgi:hypothetical protein
MYFYPSMARNSILTTGLFATMTAIDPTAFPKEASAYGRRLGAKPPWRKPIYLDGTYRWERYMLDALSLDHPRTFIAHADEDSFSAALLCPIMRILKRAIPVMGDDRLARQ